MRPGTPNCSCLLTVIRFLTSPSPGACWDFPTAPLSTQGQVHPGRFTLSVYQRPGQWHREMKDQRNPREGNQFDHLWGHSTLPPHQRPRYQAASMKSCQEENSNSLAPHGFGWLLSPFSKFHAVITTLCISARKDIHLCATGRELEI